MHLAFQTTMTDPKSTPTPAHLHLLLDLNLKMSLNPGTTVHDEINNVKYRQPDTLHEPVLSESLKQIRVSHFMFRVNCCIDFRPYLKSFNSLERYIRWLQAQLGESSNKP